MVVLPHFLFTGVLMERIRGVAAAAQAERPAVDVQMLDEIGIDPVLFRLMGDREAEAIAGDVAMNCELCKFRRAASQGLVGLGQGNLGQENLGQDNSDAESVPVGHGHHHDHHGHGQHHHGHDHGHHHHGATDPYKEPAQYHSRVWTIP
ncbi:MAG: CbiX/SirB N-terminal domain-containing protein [Cyanobacteria bacterium P01_D01_bin.73]